MFDDLKIGIIGGGPIGAMLLRYAIEYGLNVSVLDKDPNASCSKYSSLFQVGNPMDYDDVLNFGKHLDVIAIEKEVVDTNALRKLRDMGVRVYPSPDTLDIIQDKYLQKCHLRQFNIPVAMGWLVADKEELSQRTDKLPGILKKCKQGYEGRGVLKIKTVEDIAGIFNGPFVLEELIDIKQEVSVIVSRNEGGVIECYDPVHMVFDKERMLLDFQICPADFDNDIAVKLCTLAKQVAEAVDLKGIMTVEMFIATNGKIYVNELASKPDDSGHHTIEAAKISQFEQQIRSILGLPLSSRRALSSSVMMNILEPAAHRKHAILSALKTILCTNDMHLHRDGNTGGVESKRMEPIKITYHDREEAISKSVMIKHILKEGYVEKKGVNNNG